MKVYLMAPKMEETTANVINTVLKSIALDGHGGVLVMIPHRLPLDRCYEQSAPSIQQVGAGSVEKGCKMRILVQSKT